MNRALRSIKRPLSKWYTYNNTYVKIIAKMTMKIIIIVSKQNNLFGNLPLFSTRWKLKSVRRVLRLWSYKLWTYNSFPLNYIMNYSYLEGDSQNLWLRNDNFTTKSSHWRTKKVQTVILRCLMYLDPNWLKSYDVKTQDFLFPFIFQFSNFRNDW